MKGAAATVGCKARVCDNNFRLIMMRVMASRVSVAITLHEASKGASEGQVGQATACCSWGKQMTPRDESKAGSKLNHNLLSGRGRGGAGRQQELPVLKLKLKQAACCYDNLPGCRYGSCLAPARCNNFSLGATPNLIVQQDNHCA